MKVVTSGNVSSEFFYFVSFFFKWKVLNCVCKENNEIVNVLSVVIKQLSTLKAKVRCKNNFVKDIADVSPCNKHLCCSISS